MGDTQLQSQLPPGPAGSTGAAPGPDGTLQYHDASGKTTGPAVEPADSDQATQTSTAPASSKSNDPWAALGTVPAPAPSTQDPWAALGAVPAPAPQQPASPQTGVLAGIKRNTVDALTGLWHSFNQPATDEEKAAILAKVRDANAKGDKIPEEIATNPSRATLALHRLIDAPADELLKKGRDEVGVAQDLITNHKYWKGGNLYLSGLADKALSGVPLIGPVIGSIASRGEGALVPAIDKQGNRIAVSDVPAEKKDLSGAATDVGSLVALEHAPAIARAGGEAAGRVAEATGDAAKYASGKVVNAAKTVVDKVTPEMLKLPDEPAKPVSPHVTAETPLDDATIRKSFDKKLSQDARDTLREHAGDTVPAGSSVENTLMKSVRPVNETITQRGLQLNKVLQDAGPLKSVPADKITNAIENLKNDLPGGTEETFGKAIDKEVERAQDVMKTTDPTEVNNYIRELDKRIDSYNAPEEPIDSPADAADAARVTIRRILRDKINSEVPGTKPINDVLGKNLEVRNALRKKFGDVAYDPVQAEAQHLSELKKGQDYMKYEKTKDSVLGNLGVLKKLGWGAVGSAGASAIAKEVWDSL